MLALLETHGQIAPVGSPLGVSLPGASAQMRAPAERAARLRPFLAGQREVA